MIPFGDTLTLGVLLAVLGAVGLAGQSLTVRYGTIRSRSADAMVVVLLVNVVVLAPAAFLLADPFNELTGRSIVIFVAAGLVGTLAGRAFHYEGIKRIGASRAEPIKASQPLHASLIAIVVLGEVVTPGHALAMVAIVVGVALISVEHRRSEDTAGDGGLVGLAFPFAAAFFFGIEPTFAKLGFAEGVSPLAGLVVKTVGASVGLLVYLGATDSLPRPTAFDRQELPWLAGAGVANTVFLLAYYVALDVAPVSVVVPLVQTSPLLVIVVSLLLVRDDLERVGPRLVVGALIAVVGAIGVTLVS